MVLSDERLREKVKLWFFRDLSDMQRLALFRLTMPDIPGRELETHAAQSSGLAFVLDALSRRAAEQQTYVSFNDWFCEPEGYALRAERFEGDIEWLKAAFEAGRSSRAAEQ